MTRKLIELMMRKPGLEISQDNGKVYLTMIAGAACIRSYYTHEESPSLTLSARYKSLYRASIERMSSFWFGMLGGDGVWECCLFGI